MNPRLREAGTQGCQGALRHPLEVFPIFRRLRPSLPRDLAYTAVWNALIAGVFALFAIAIDPPRSASAFAWGRFGWSIFVIANCIGFIMHAEFVIAEWVFPGIHRQPMSVRAAWYTVLPIVAVLAGWWLGASILAWDSGRVVTMSAVGMASIAGVTVVMSGVMLAIFIPRERAAKAQAAYERERARVAAAEREATLAKLKVLEAQIEPHFLYNTLANAISLIDADPQSAKRMLDCLIALLRAAACDEGTTTIGRQAELVGAYLDILALRMGSRLAWSIDVSPDIARLHIPPMLLQPIVENAVKHGLEPKVEGGRVDVTARREGMRLDLVVEDTGLGVCAMRDPSSSGLGLANVRARLTGLYGAAAGLTIEDRKPCGTRVVVSMPITAEVA